jgi:hypothetical protein
MKHWYSRRGARRGLVFAGFAAALWLSWAMGYVHGSRPTASSVTVPGKANVTSSRGMRV